jgi:hypothetical protein
MKSDNAVRITPAINECCVGPALVAGPKVLGKRPADKRQPYNRLHRYG